MPLRPKRPDLGALALDSVTVIYHLVQKTIDSVNMLMQGVGIGDSVAQQADIDIAQHYGYRSIPPADTEHVVGVADGSHVALADRADPPSGAPALADKDALMYTDSGHYVHLDDSGDLVIEPKSGQKIKLGVNASKAVVLSGDQCIKLSIFTTWMSQVETAINTLAPGSVTPYASSAIATVSGSATEVDGD